MPGTKRRRGWGGAASRVYRVSFWGDENILELDRVGGFITLSMYPTALNIPFKMVNLKINIIY